MLKRLPVLAIAVLLAAGTAAAQAPPQAPPEVTEWIQAFFRSYSARDTKALSALFAEEATIERLSLDEYLDNIRKNSDLFSSFSVSARGEAKITALSGGYAVRQPAVRTFTSRENGLSYRHLVTYDWTLVRRERLVALRMNVINEPEEGLPVGNVRIATFPEGKDGRPGKSPQRAFRPDEPVCLVITGDEVQGGHFFTVQLRSPDGDEYPLPGLFGLGTAGRPGPLFRPMWGCLDFPSKGWQQGTWKAEVFVEGRVVGRTEWEVRP